MDANTMGAELLRRLGSSNYNLVNFDDREKSVLLNEAMDELIVERYLADSNIKRKGFEADIKRRLDLDGLLTSHTTFKRLYENGDLGDFMLGTKDNGALETPDLDYQEVSNGDYIETDFGIFVRIPDECLFIVADTCKTSRGSTVKNAVPIEVVTHEEYYFKLHNRYENPYYNKVWRLGYGNYTTAGTNGSLTSTKYTNSVLTGFTGKCADMSDRDITIDTFRSSILVPGKDWTVEEYRMQYVKRPSRILVDTISPASQRNCELHIAIHTEIVDKAVAKAISNRLPEQAKYQIADKLDKENQ